MKRLLAFILILVMLIGMMPMQIYATGGTQVTEVVTDSTCTKQGYTTYTCACGDSYVDDYVDATGHSYKNGACTGCGAEHLNLPNYKGKVISILGDSISTFAGYIPGEDGFNLAHRARYPQSNLLTDVNETWWMQVLTALDAKLGINDSWAGSRVINTISGNSGDLGEKAAMASLTRIQNLGSNGTPDVILFYGGTNDIVGSVPLGTFDPDTAPVAADLTVVKWNTVADAYAAALLRMKHFYPDAQIIAMLPTYTSNYYTNAKLEQYNAMFASICSHYGVGYLDLRDCGITTANMPDGIHPDASGMDYITGAVVDMLLNDVEMEAGETTVYSVEHKLTDAKASLSYYKGIRSGQAFAETLTGDNLAVTVTMAGKDISDAVYQNGEIRIPSVTGNLVITAEGQFTADGHLQQLPENLCPGINLWTVLEKEDMYYTFTGWAYHNHDKVRSVTFPVTPGDKIYATSFGKGADNGSIEGNQSQADGIRVTFFFADGKVKSMAPGEVYTEFAANGCLSAPAGAIAVCVPMWTPYDSNKLYILSAEHDYEATVTAPTCTEQGYTTYTCACGDSYADDYVDATGHSYKNGICTGCGIADPNVYSAAVVSGGSTTTYQTLDEAFNAASAGDTVMLLMDAKTSFAAVPVNVNLDLNGYVLDATYVACFGNIEDTSQDNTGLLKVEKTNFLIQRSNSQIPILDKDGYRFVEILKFNQHLYTGTYNLFFQTLFEEAAHELLLQGLEQSGITVGVKISWQQDQGIRSQNFIYNDSMVKKYIESYKGSDSYGSMFFLTLNGADQLKDLTFQIVVKSECGVEVLSEPIVHPGTNSN